MKKGCRILLRNVWRLKEKRNKWYYYETCSQCRGSKGKGWNDCGLGYCHCDKTDFLLTREDKNEGIEIINQELEKKQNGQRTKVYHLRDWIFSRQRYWGEPIPIIHWENGEQEILKDEQLPLKLPTLTDFAPSSLYYSPLQKVNDWVNVKREDGKSEKEMLMLCHNEPDLVDIILLFY